MRIYNEETGQITTSFVANGTKYFVRMPQDGLPLRRANKLLQVLSVAGFNATFGEQLERLNRMEALFDGMIKNGGTGAAELGAEIMNMKRAVLETDRNWTYAVYACGLFIVTETEDLSTFDDRLIERKIDDWNKAGIDDADFFLLAMHWEVQRNKRLTQSLQLLNQRVLLKR